ncbi:uncharacterized protein N7459_000394 [Penicillium hispanicum]|uniref:uncharacterized protein n=1 Tax=Penicillium hispanicum TaxID=1080232 RepID=UPI002540C4A7|nr:uncharacterized protein N7459_000394 [Penicillium hispanicum]KAJ5594186.1 hypothetical protein N7459_000394 [Penicillium hispanicum]
MDPISITGLIIDVSHILSSLISYAKAVQGAKSEMRKMSEELFALKGILEHLSTTQTLPDSPKSELDLDSPSPFDRDVMARILHTTNEFLQSLLSDLEIPANKFKRLKQKLQWPFTQEQVNEHLDRLERVKSWLILVLTADHVAADRDLQREMSGLASSLRDDLQMRQEERNQVANKELFEWMAPVSPASLHLQASKVHRIGTGRWLMDGHLKKWLQDQDEQRRMLVLVGKSGTGKTTLFAQMVDELTSMASHDPSLCVAYFYCSIGSTASQVSANVLGSLVAQLSGANPSILKPIWSIYNQIPKSQAHRFPIEIAALEDIIIECASGMRQLVILVDAVNESHDSERIQQSLLRLANISTNIRVVLTTTATMFPPKHANALELRINAEMMRGDIDAFIDYQLEHSDTLRNLPSKFKAEIDTTLLRNADGSFRWVQLSLDNLCAQRTARSMREALRTLPGTLRETYANTLERIAPEDRSLARETLFWLSFVQSPLTLRSLNEIVVLDETSTSLDEDMMLVPPNILLHICQGLINQDHLGYVNLAHSSVKEFLTSDWIRSSRVQYFSLDPATADMTIMRRCLSYLCLDNFVNGYIPFLKNPWDLMKTKPFMAYAAHFWPIHGSSCDFTGPERDLVNRFFATRHLPGRGNYGAWIQALVRSMDASVIEMTQPLYYAASFGMIPVVKAILASDPEVDINAPGGRTGATPVFIAAWRHNNDMVEILLRAGADPTIRDPDTGFSVIHLARDLAFPGLGDVLARWKAEKKDQFGSR